MAQLGSLIDQLRKTRDRRKRLEADARDLKAEEDALELKVIEALKSSDLTSGRGRTAQATIVPETIPVIEDWEQVWNYARKKNLPELLQRRLGVTAVRERWDHGVAIPGVGTFTRERLSLTSVR